MMHNTNIVCSQRRYDMPSGKVNQRESNEELGMLFKPRLTLWLTVLE